MTEFLIKSSSTMAVLLGVYYLLLESEKMHRFNRFYLLTALVFSLAVPFITVITYVTEVSLIAKPMPSNIIVGNTTKETPIDYWFFIGWGLYILVTAVLAIRFIKNIWHFVRKASQNPHISIGHATLVLLEEKTLPHTFLNWIFVNRSAYEKRSIEDELYTHEYTHVKQKHTLDILFIEALKTIFWFNPLLYCYKKAIQLNHEFLADEKVIGTTANTVDYQNLLLDKASVGTTFSLASNLNFSITKKRFLMMTKTTSIAKARLLKASITPVVAGLMMLFCTKTVAQQSSEPKLTPEQEAKLERFRISPEEEAQLKKTNPDMFSEDPAVNMKDTEFSFTDKKGNTVVKKGYAQLTDEEKKKVVLSPVKSAGTLNFYENPQTINPEYPGGIEEFTKFFFANFVAPKTDTDIDMKLYYSLTIKTDGSVADIKLNNRDRLNEKELAILPNVEKEVIRVLALTSKKWKPALSEGKPVNANLVFPLAITIKQ